MVLAQNKYLHTRILKYMFVRVFSCIAPRGRPLKRSADVFRFSHSRSETVLRISMVGKEEFSRVGRGVFSIESGQAINTWSFDVSQTR